MNVNLSGEFASSLSTAQLSSTDFLLLSEPVLKTKRSEQHVSKHIDFKVLSSSILSSLRSIQNFGTMVFEDTEDYSPINHSHDCYNKTSISALLSANNSTVFIGSMIIDGRKTPLYAPKAAVKQLKPPLVGQLKFVHDTAKKDIDIMSEDFDGWVYADGSSYECKIFEGAETAFENDGNAFYVPDLNSFIKPNSAPYGENNMNETYDHVDPLHNHTLHTNLSGNVTGTLSYKFAGNGNGSTSHGAASAKNTQTYEIELDYSNIRISSKSKDYIKQSKSTAEETYPSYVAIPAMVYIGYPRPSNAERTIAS